MNAFQFKHIALASMLAAGVLAASPALAQVAGSPAEAIVNDANANGRVLFISGATAVRDGFVQIAESMLDPAAGIFQFMPVYSPRTGPERVAARRSARGAYYAVAGRLREAAGGWSAGQAVIIIHRFRGGSVWGVNPVARAERIESLNVSTAACAATGTADSPAGAGTAAAPFLCTLTDGSSANPHRVPDAGVSDVAPPLFREPFNTEGEVAAPGLSVSELDLLRATPIYSLGFGVPVSNNVPDVRLTRAALSGIMTGFIGNWGQVDASLPEAIRNADMLVCRRVPGSGTQAIANLYFGNFPCTANANTPATRDDTPAWNPAPPAGGIRTFTVEGNVGGVNVVELNTSAEVRACLDNAAAASGQPFVAAATPAVLNADGSVTPGVGYTHFRTADRDGRRALVQFRNGRVHAAVGLLSLDSLNNADSPSRAGTSGWSFRALDGAGRLTWDATAAGGSGAPVVSGTGRLPTVANLINGTWGKQGVISFNVPTRTTGNMEALANAFANAASRPALLQALPSLRHAAAAVRGTPDPTSTGQVQQVAYLGGDQCAPLNLKP